MSTQGRSIARYSAPIAQPGWRDGSSYESGLCQPTGLTFFLLGHVHFSLQLILTKGTNIPFSHAATMRDDDDSYVHIRHSILFLPQQ